VSPPPAVVLISSADQKILDVARQVAEARHLNILGALQKPILAATLHKMLDRLEAPRAAMHGKALFQVSAQDLRTALVKGEIDVFVQPKLDMSDGHLSGVEALARWISPDRGILPPSAFIPVAESSGLIGPLTERILDRALAACEEWNRAGLRLKIATNVSAALLADLNFPEQLVAGIERHHVDPDQLMLEITESTVLDHLVESLDVLARLRLKGIGLSIDDFGTGYSSLLQLRRVPFTELKIDRAFASSAMSDDAALSIVKSCIALARSMNLTVVVEGIESRNDWELMRGLGCDQAQGYLIAEPMPMAQFVDWARRHPACLAAQSLPSFVMPQSTQTPASSHRGQFAFERLFDVSDDAIVLVDKTGRMKRHNVNAEAMFGYSASELQNQPVEMLVPQRFRNTHVKTRSAYHAAPTMRPMERGFPLFGLRRDGTEFPVSILLSPLTGKDGAMTLAIIREQALRHAGLRSEPRSEITR
jgi:PAS domain S-box-containing protein